MVNKNLIKRKSKTPKKCHNCQDSIKNGEFYYSEEPEDKFLYTLHNKKYCLKCGDEIINKKMCGKVRVR